MRPRLTYAQKSVLLQDVGYGRYAITEAGRRALQKDLS